MSNLPRRALAWALVASAAIITSAGKFAASSTINRIHTDGSRSCLACTIDKVRGGAAHYEPNPNYQGSATLGDVNDDGFYRASFQSLVPNSRPPPLTQLIRSYFSDLRKFSPILCDGTIASIVLFLLWQRPNKVLRDHFVCSHYNVVRRKRYHSLILSAFSHASFRHVALNLYAFSMFGRSVRQTLGGQGTPLWAFVFPAAIFANLAFLAFDGGHGSCIGLSGVTCALLGFDSLVYPSKELRLFVSFIPITLPAYYLLLGLLGFSVLGIFGIAGRSNVAHSTHLGGLVFGALYYEAFKRGWPRQWSYRARKAWNALRGG